MSYRVLPISVKLQNYDEFNIEYYFCWHSIISCVCLLQKLINIIFIFNKICVFCNKVVLNTHSKEYICYGESV